MRTMTSLDIFAVLTEIKESIIGGSVINIYDVSKKVYIIKISNKDSKLFLLLEAGSRIYLTQFMQSKNSMPSGFAMKLRKHLKGKRINNIIQLGFDRVILIKFGIGDYEHNLIIQFYVSGNIFLTDNNYKILSSLRQHVPELKQSTCNIYPIPCISDKLSILNPDLNILTFDNLKKFLTVGNYTITELKRIIPSFSNSNIKLFISENHQITNENIDQITENLLSVILKILNLIDDLKTNSPGGFITVDPKYQNASLDSIPATAIIDYSPVVNELNSNNIRFNSYNECLDYYFGKFETYEKPSKKLSKADKIKIDQEKRIINMTNQVKTAEKNASLIDKNSAIVDECISLMRTLIATGSKWDDIWDEITMQKHMGHKTAMIFDKVDFKKGEIYLNLKESSEDESYSTVPVSVNHSVFSNLRGIHNMRKTVLAKIDRTGTSMAMAIEKAQKKDKTASKSEKSNIKIERTRVKKRYWFEKFKWFISSDDYLVLGGRDSIQNEILVKRYMETNDIYIHADIHGAASCIVKNNSNNPIPQRTLIEAGQFSVCNSNAWKSKFMISAWWVESSQVSKTPESGDYLPSGSFVIRGKKNFLPPSKLEVGLAIIYLNQKSVNDAQQMENTQTENPTDNKSELPNDEQLEEQDDQQLDEQQSQHSQSEDDQQLDEQQSQHSQSEDDQQLEDEQQLEHSQPELDQSQPIHHSGSNLNTFIPNLTKSQNVNNSRKISNNKQTNSNNNKILRGHRGKKKKMKKYEDQDSDIEEIRMMLMGSLKPTQAKDEPETTKIPVIRKPIIKDKPFDRPPPFTTSIISRISYSDSALDSSTSSTLNANATKEKQSINEKILTSGAATNMEVLADEKSDLPFQCVSMCGPWEAISRYRLRVKLLPGNGKKGQIASEALHAFKKAETDEFRGNLLSQLKTEDLNLVIIGDCKLDKRVNS